MSCVRTGLLGVSLCYQIMFHESPKRNIRHVHTSHGLSKWRNDSWQVP